jgi:TonB-linked SusC/RagA family outer membrane protein
MNLIAKYFKEFTESGSCYNWKILLILFFMCLGALPAGGNNNTGFSVLQNQSKLITGTVTANNGESIIGANIVVKGTNIGTITDINGRFSLNVPVNAILTVTYIGYSEKEVIVGEQSSLNIQLSENTELLEEVVVVGYGSQKRETMTGAVSNIRTDDIVRSTVADLTNSLTGKMPGIVSVQRNAEPGEDAASLFIRGRSTLNDNSPLILVDGIERDFSHLNPNEIESLSILKDASATAVYGVRGANGVILITTKRGKEGKPTIDYNGYAGIQNPTKKPSYLGSYDYGRLYNEALLNDDPGIPADELPYQPEDLEAYRNHTSPYTHPDVNWYEEVLNENAMLQRHSVSLTGGTEKVKYFVSFGYLNQKGMFKNINLDKYNLRANLDAEVTSRTKVSVDLSSLITQRNYPGVGGATIDGGIMSTALYLPPDAFPIKNEDGSWASLWGTNPIADMYESGYRKNDNKGASATFILNQELDFITQGLSAKVVGSYDFSYGFWKDWYTPYRSFIKQGDEYEEVASGRKPSLYEGFERFHTTTFEAHLNWIRSFGKHNLGLLALYTQSASYWNSQEASREEFNSSALDQLFAGPETYMRNGGGASESGREGFVGRLTYNFDQRYLFEFNFGYNGSENFPPSHRYGFFPAFSLGWRLSEERFFENIDFVNNLKIRASYGEVGNDQVGYRRFMYKQPVSFRSNYVFGGSSVNSVQTLRLGEMANPDITWERAQKTNIGFESDWLASMFKLNVDVFFEKRNNILANRERSIPATVGVSLPVENIAKVDNNGFEIEFTYQNRINDFSYSASLNFTHNKNTIRFIDEPANIPDSRKQTGKPMGQFFGYICEGYYNTEEDLQNYPKMEGLEPRLGDLRYKDINNDNTIDSDDITAIGKSDIPENIFGLMLNASYKGIDINALLQGASGFNTYFWGEAAQAFYYGSSALDIILDRWTPENREKATYPALTLEREAYHTEGSSYWLRNANYLRVKNLEIGYTFPKDLFRKLAVSKCRIYVSAQNLFTFDNIDYWDPEAPQGSAYFYPIQKVLSLGLNLSF